ncbi:hypothetical protein CPHO_00125 [Corynebacterium phocae]|uniref:Peptidase S54 rhomboid domain-containing protein n=1 Tax=Corynebacterium phocae TaxID=161895 RepID=A0A1L7D0P1_9CORY|nr:rhomboid family intramembrane serine protease [Corynebacterium phocae]APT91602.1 hypothetical protein CPHO_00125 [Corynebacterium phocae]KAA8720670.1 rhomboid family intramembrane serine protease [Corynebacterium phocae]
MNPQPLTFSQWGRSYLSVAPVTGVIVLACIAAWTATAVQSLSLSNSYYGSSLAHDWTLLGPLVADGGYARPLGAMFMHLDASHLMMNVLMLVFVGREVERAYGAGLYALSYLAGGLGSAAAVLAQDFDTPTVGASGALYAMMVLLVGVYRKQRLNLRAPLALILANLAYTFMSPGVSLWGHVGGLVTGVILLGALSLPHQTARWIAVVGVVLTSVGAVALGAGLWG